LFIYYSPPIWRVTNLLRQSNVQIAFLSTDTVYDIFNLNTPNTINEHSKSGIYKLKGFCILVLWQLLLTM